MNGRRTNGAAPGPLQIIKPPWSGGLVFVCRDCDGYSKDLRRGLKDALDDVGAKKRVRVVACGCLDICPKRGTAIVTAAADGDATACTVVRGSHPDRTDLRPLVAPFERRGATISGERRQEGERR